MNETFQFSLVKKLTMLKGKIFSKTFFENCAFYGLDTEPEPVLQLVKSRDRNCNLLKVGSGTVKNSYGSATLVNSHSNLWPAIWTRCNSSPTSATAGSICCSMWSLSSGPPSPTTPCPSRPFAHGSPRRRWDSHSTSVADPGCLSRIQKQQLKRGMKKNFVKPFFVATNFTKL